MTENIYVSVARDFSDTPGPRSRDEGPHSGEEFLECVLRPRFTKAQTEGRKVVIDLDGCEGFATSFLEAVFGGLAREFGSEVVDGTLDYVSNDEPLLIEEIRSYVKEARNQ